MSETPRKKASEKALRRSHRLARGTTLTVGLLAVAAAALALLVGFRVFGEYRAQRPVLDPIGLSWLASQLTVGRAVAIGLGVLLLAFGLWWFVASARPERRPDVALQRDAEGSTTVTSSAVTEAVQADAEQVDGVEKARARTVGNPDEPALRLTVWLATGTDLKAVWSSLEGVLARARQSLGRPDLPAAIHLQLDTAPRDRVR